MGVQWAELARCSGGPVHAAAPAVGTKDSVVGNEQGRGPMVASTLRKVADGGRGWARALVLVRRVLLHIA